MTTLAARQKGSARHEAAHAVAYTGLKVGRVEQIRILGRWTDEYGEKGGVTRLWPYTDADDGAKIVGALAGPAADPRHDPEAARAAVAADVREFAGGDVPPGLDDDDLLAYWGVAIEFVELALPKIEAVAAALLASPVEAEDEHGEVTHELSGDAFRKALVGT